MLLPPMDYEARWIKVVNDGSREVVIVEATSIRDSKMVAIDYTGDGQVDLVAIQNRQDPLLQWNIKGDAASHQSAGKMYQYINSLFKQGWTRFASRQETSYDISFSEHGVVELRENPLLRKVSLTPGKTLPEKDLQIEPDMGMANDRTACDPANSASKRGCLDRSKSFVVNYHFQPSFFWGSEQFAEAKERADWALQAGQKVFAKVPEMVLSAKSWADQSGSKTWECKINVDMDGERLFAGYPAVNCLVGDYSDPGVRAVCFSTQTPEHQKIQQCMGRGGNK